MHNEEVHSLYSSPNTILVKSSLRWAGHVACMVEVRNAYKIWVGRDEGKKPN
jgi:hypothetical protein